jgi:excisionase family DNA binding protein
MKRGAIATKRGAPASKRAAPTPREFGSGSDQILTTRMVADYLHCHLSTVYRLAKDGRIPHFKLGGDFRFQKSAIEDWIERGGGARH